jgi:hypothetical protein
MGIFYLANSIKIVQTFKSPCRQTCSIYAHKGDQADVQVANKTAVQEEIIPLEPPFVSI